MRRRLYMMGLLSVLACSKQAVEKAALRSEPRVLVSADEAVVHFPAMPLDSLGCDELDTIPSLRSYSWTVAVDIPDERVNHANALHVRTSLPKADRLKIEELQRGLTVSQRWVLEQWGEPPFFGEDIPDGALNARVDGQQVVLRLRGPNAVERFFRHRPKRASLIWCKRSKWLSSVDVRIEYQH